ncbi:hypothetical protein V2J09_017672 [Rumex salicifolius]
MKLLHGSLDDEVVNEKLNKPSSSDDNVLDNDSAHGSLDDEVVNEKLNKPSSSDEASSYQKLQVIALTGEGSLEENDVVLGRIESEQVRIVANKLEHLLQKQQKELDEARLKHELAVSDLLKELPHKVRCKVFKLCSYKVPDYRMHCERHLYAENAGRPDSVLFPSQTSKAEAETIITPETESMSKLTAAKDSSPTASRPVHLSKVKNPLIGAEGFVVGPVLRDKLSSMKRGSKPDLGIAVILKDDLEKP